MFRKDYSVPKRHSVHTGNASSFPEEDQSTWPTPLFVTGETLYVDGGYHIID
jgi:hypothetical protein